MSPVHLERTGILLLLGELFCSCLLGPVGKVLLSRYSVSLLIFWLIVSILKVNIKVIVAVSISPLRLPCFTSCILELCYQPALHIC